MPDCVEYEGSLDAVLALFSPPLAAVAQVGGSAGVIGTINHIYYIPMARRPAAQPRPPGHSRSSCRALHIRAVRGFHLLSHSRALLFPGSCRVVAQNPAAFSVTTATCTDRNNNTVSYPVRNGLPDPSRWMAKPPGAAAAAPVAPAKEAAAAGGAAGLSAVPITTPLGGAGMMARGTDAPPSCVLLRTAGTAACG